MKKHLTLLLFILLCIPVLVFTQTKEKINKTEVFSIGETVSFSSEIMEEERSLNIYLPSGYEKNTAKRYPVIYLLDGSKDEDFIHIAGLVQFGSFSWIQMIPESIVVGIANVDRKRDFTYPSGNAQDRKELPISGGSAKFIQFLKVELMPSIEQRYRTKGPNTLIGQSLGGLLATEILFKHPDVFDNYLIISPSLWWDDQRLLAYTPANTKNKKSIYIGVGKEGEIMEGLARKLHKKLENLESANRNLYFNFFEQQSHGDVLHLAVYDAFEKIFRSVKKE